MKPAQFDYHRPQTLSEALHLLGSLEGAKILAGGQSLVPMLNMRFVQPDNVIDVNKLDLSYIKVDGDRLLVGSATRQRDLELSPLVKLHIPLMVEAFGHVGHVQTRNRGTIGGSLCHLDPAAEMPALCLTLDAEIAVESAARGRRILPMREFAANYMSPAIEADEMVTEIMLPIWPKGHGYAFEEFARRHGDFAIASACVQLSFEDSRIDRIAITVGGLTSTPSRVPEAEALLRGAEHGDLKIEQAATFCGALDAVADAHATIAYRQHLATVMASRALNRAVNRATKVLR